MSRARQIGWLTAAALGAVAGLWAARPAWAQMQVEALDRGLIVVRAGADNVLGWRLLGTEPYATPFNVYRDGRRVNAAPLTGPTTYVDAGGPAEAVYTVRAVVDGAEQPAGRPALWLREREGATAAWFDIPLDRPPAGPGGASYSPGDGSAGDLDGDGRYEIVLKWDPSNAADNARAGATDPVLIDAYSLEGRRLWRIDLGRNIRAGAHYTQFLVYDLDGDAEAEVMLKTAPGTRAGDGRSLKLGPAAGSDPSADFRNAQGRVLAGPEYLTVFAGRTGVELATTEYVPPRGDLRSWGDDYGNRGDRFLAAVAYLDGRRPSAVFCRGYYGRTALAAWDWRDGKLTRRWVFDSQERGNRGYAGRGNHQLAVLDADGDGRHDIIYGSAAVSSGGRGLHRTDFGHGDALHAAHMVKGDATPKIWQPHEAGGHGVTLRQADTGQVIFQHRADWDVGRACAADLDPAVPGFKFWAAGGLGLYNVKGEVVGRPPRSMNFVIWWDGRLSRCLLDGTRLERWDVRSGRGERLLTARGAWPINSTKANPVLQADLLGDWREEFILRRADERALRVYTSTMPTPHRLWTLMHDPVYRVGAAWQNAGYNQPPHPGFYLACDMDLPPPRPNVQAAGKAGGAPAAGAADRGTAAPKPK